jgi:putative glycosyltransferase (TIGR04372 family)
MVGAKYGNSYLIDRLRDVDRTIIPWSKTDWRTKAQCMSPLRVADVQLVSHGVPYASCYGHAHRPCPTARPADHDRTIGKLIELGLAATRPIALLAFSESTYYGKKFLLKAGDRYSNQPDFVPAVRDLMNGGWNVVRVGSSVGPLDPLLADAGVIDYAGKIRSEAGDVVLAELARVTITDAVGAWWIPMVFGRRVLITNQYRIRHMCMGQHVTYVPSLYLSKFHGRLLNLPEIFALKKHAVMGHPELRLQMVKVSPEEIRTAVANFVNDVTPSDADQERVAKVQDTLARLMGTDDRSLISPIDHSYLAAHWDVFGV